jgi:hypothetical protein
VTDTPSTLAAVIAERDAARMRAESYKDHARRWRDEVMQLRAHLDAARAMLRIECAEAGCNDWPDNLHLADVIEKHLCRSLWAKVRP